MPKKTGKIKLRRRRNILIKPDDRLLMGGFNVLKIQYLIMILVGIVHYSRLGKKNTLLRLIITNFPFFQIHLKLPDDTCDSWMELKWNF